MADPLSLSASLAGLVSLADTVFRHVYKYVRGAMAAKEEITKIAQELQSFTGILRGVEVLAQSLEEAGDTYDPAIRVHHVYYCEQTLNKINDRMKRAAQKIEKGKSRDGVMQQLKWPFSKSETQEVLEELERHKTNMNLGITTDSMQKMQLLLSKQQETDIAVSEIRQVVRELRTEILVDARKRRVLEFFMDTATVNPQTILDTNIKLRQPTTGIWLTESPVFIQWLDTPGSNIWLCGIPGGGKTVLAGAVIQETLTRASQSPKIGAAFFFCDYKNENTLQNTNIMGAIASQLARQKNEAFDLLQDYYDDLHPVDGLPKKADPNDLRAVVGRMCELFDQVLTVVDGIDECGDSMDETAEILSDLANDSRRMSVAVFSRDEVGIRRQLEDIFKPITIAARSKDIELYVRAELEALMNRGRLRVTNASLKDAIREALVDQAQGMFRWVACQLDYLCGFSSDFERRKALGQLPPTLHETYLRLLQRLSKYPAPTQSKIQMCFQFIAFSPDRLSTVQLREAISTPELLGSCLNDDNMVSEDDILSMCGSLLKKSADDKYFEFAHFSVLEFLEHRSLAETPGLEYYRISQSDCYRLLATQSLRYLQLSNFVLDPLDVETLMKCSLIITRQYHEGYSFHRLAARYSLIMTTRADSQSMLHGLMKSLFHPSKTSCLVQYAMTVFLDLCRFCSMKGLVDGWNAPMVSREFAIKLLSDDFRPIHLAAALNLPSVCDYLISTGSDPTTKSSFGTPLELSVASFLRFIHDDLDSKSVKTHPHYLRALIATLLPSGTQRNSTVEIFERTSPEKMDPDPSLQSEDTAMLLPASIIAFVHNDFRVLQRLLSRGATLKDSTYTAVFGELMRQSSEPIRTDGEPLIGFLQHIGSLLEPESGWQLEIGRVIWNTAVELGLPFTRDPTVTDFRITLSKDALVSRAIAAIKGHDLQSLQECLSDGRLDLSERHRNTDNENLTLLHFAVMEDNLPATSHLVKAGCDPNIPSVGFCERWLPIHDCSSIAVFEELLASGAHATDVESHKGENIWHLCATSQEHKIGFFRSIAQRYPLETAEALLTRSKDGHTPLQLVLKSRDSPNLREDRVERAMEYIAICSDIVGFWSIHEPLFGQAAESGSERIIRRLIEVGARLDQVGPSLATPLHCLGIESSSASVRCLKKLYPGALNMRFEDRLPLQLYLERCSRHGHPVEEAVAQQLLSTDILESIDGKRTTLWEHYCQLNAVPRNPYDTAGLGIIWAWLLRSQSAMQAYENATGRSGLGLIFSCLITLHPTQELGSLVPAYVLAQAIEASRYWESMKMNSSVLRFLQFAIRNQCYQLIDVLLEHGVSVSEAVDNYSSIQIACQPPLAIWLCSAAEGKEILCKMLNLANLTHLNDHSKDGLTILHRLATKEADGSQLHWLIERLLAKGVDINKRKRFGPVFTPIAHHILEGSRSCAEYLLQMGADPGMADHFEIDAVMEASHQGFRLFLDKVLETSKNQSSIMEWGRKIDITLVMRDDRKIRLLNANVLHLTCWGGPVECLEFYFNNNLIDDLDTSCNEGWTAMHVSALGGDSVMIEYLSSNDCKVMPQTVEGLTPLHLAVQEKKYDACKTLIRLGAQDVPDATGMTPTMHALKGNDRVMLQLLRETLSSENKIRQPLDGSLPHKAPKALIASMERAIESDDIEECKRLYAVGCPINLSIKGWSPLTLALQKGHLDISEWLLDSGANTTAIHAGDKGYHNVIEACLNHSELCKLLARLVDRCIHDGSGWPLLGNSGLLSAIGNGNTEGLSLLLELIQERCEDISTATNIPQAEVLHTIVNQERELDDEGWCGTALHCAVEEDNAQAVRILLENGAVIDKPDSSGRTALGLSTDQEISTMLVNYGASLVDHFYYNIVDPLGWDIEVFTNVVSAYSDTNNGQHPLASDTIPGFLRFIYDTRGSVNCTIVTMRPAHLVSILKADIDLNRELGSGRSLMHIAIANRDSSTFVLNSNLALEAMAPFPWHLRFWDDLPFLSSMWRHFRRKLGQEDFVRIAHLQPTRGLSPLCNASLNDDVDMIRNCLSLGADVDFEGSPHGSAIIIASACGNLEAVRILVQAGASLSYRGQSGHKSVFTFCRSKTVRRWLLVGRFTEQQMIDERPHWGNGERVRPWAGTAVARLKLVGSRAMRYGETRTDYAERLAKMRKEWRGKAIPPICLDGIACGS